MMSTDVNVYQQLLHVYETYLDVKHPANGNYAVSLLLLNHAFVVANILYNMFRTLPRADGTRRVPFLVGLLMMFVMGLGGAIISALLQGNPQLVLQDDRIALFFFAAWLLVTQSPFNLFHHLTNNVLVKALAYAVEGYFVAITVMGGVDAAVLKFPGRHVAPVLLGAIGAIGGGGILMPFFMNLYLGESRLSSEISNPTLGIKLAFAASLLYYLGSSLAMFPTDIVVELSATESVIVTPHKIVCVVYVLFFLLLWFRSSVLSMLPVSRPAPVDAAKLVPKQPQQQQQAAVSGHAFATTMLKDTNAFAEKLAAVRAQSKKTEHEVVQGNPAAAASATTTPSPTSQPGKRKK